MKTRRLTRLIVYWLESKYPKVIIKNDVDTYMTFNVIWIGLYRRILVHAPNFRQKRVEIKYDSSYDSVYFDHNDPDFFSKVEKLLELTNV